MAPGLILLSLLWIFGSLFIRSTGAVDCFGVGGGTFPDDVICPGSNACCGTLEACQSNRLCHNKGQNNDTFVRGPCALYPYNTNSCAQICLYNETEVGGGFLPRVSVCADGSFCCDASPNCCEAGEGVFLDEKGAIVASPTSTSTSTTQGLSTSTSIPTSATSSDSSSASSSSSTASILSSTSSPTSGPSVPTSSESAQLASKEASGLSSGAKIGIGIGVPILLLVVAGLFSIIWFQRRRLKLAEAAGTAPRPTPYPPPSYADGRFSNPKELPGSQPPRPNEMTGYQPQGMVELPAGYYGSQTPAKSSFI